MIYLYLSNNEIINKLMSVKKPCILKCVMCKEKDKSQFADIFFPFVFYFMIWYLKLENSTYVIYHVSYIYIYTLYMHIYIYITVTYIHIIYTLYMHIYIYIYIYYSYIRPSTLIHCRHISKINTFAICLWFI